MSPTVILGLSDVYGSCSTIWMLRRSFRSSPPRIAKMSRPRKRAVPLVGGSSRISTCASVDLPQPDSPTTPSVSPSFRSNETPSTARTCPTVCLNNTPTRTGKCLTRSRTSRMGSAPDDSLRKLRSAPDDSLRKLRSAPDDSLRKLRSAPDDSLRELRSDTRHQLLREVAP